MTNDPGNPMTNGERQPWLPKTTASVFTTYTFNSGFPVSGGVRYVGAEKTYDNASTPTRDIPSYVLFDAAVGHGIDRWHFQLNLKNIFDRHYYVAPWDTYAYGVYPGEPRSIALTARREF